MKLKPLLKDAINQSIWEYARAINSQLNSSTLGLKTLRVLLPFFNSAPVFIKVTHSLKRLNET